MSIQINHVIIHKLVKEKNEPIHENVIRREVLPPTSSIVIKLIEGVLGVYGKQNNSVQYGVFRPENGGEFPKTFSSYHNPSQGLSEDAFKSLTEHAMNQLYLSASGVAFATGGFILFADYMQNSTRFLLVVMVKQKPGQHITDDIDVKEIEYIDLTKLHQAARINFDKYEQYSDASDSDKQEVSYLSFVRAGNGDKASGYFINAFGCQAGSTSAKATEVSVSESVRYFKKNDSLRQYAANVKEDMLHLYDQKEKAKESVKLSDIESIARRYFNPEEADDLAEDLISHLNSEEVGVPNEFTVNRRKLEKMTHVIFNSEEFKLTFDKNDLGSTPHARFYFDGEQLIIKKLPDSLKNELNELLSESNKQ
ncbi:nucleoid-associated protein [Vibrio sp. OPT18]|uniref:nucleoid-associated protein n=1 Tax=Vibrio sp. OPT18 TaxID=2778641 RepID=UPI00187FD4F3|nr:nucleoid-associated protein [Vibrio sp. OPT18]MBE8578724.1 nucleoid-associated protein [Vibrio sp. OPT18]